MKNASSVRQVSCLLAHPGLRRNRFQIGKPLDPNLRRRRLQLPEPVQAMRNRINARFSVKLTIWVKAV
jgi:hypothetical protein